MAQPNLNKVEFVKSAAAETQFIQSPMPRIAFAGKSNVGKSSVINRLLNRKNFARVGSEPGKTVHVNYFLIDSRAYFIDLPGCRCATPAPVTASSPSPCCCCLQRQRGGSSGASDTASNSTSTS